VLYSQLNLHIFEGDETGTATATYEIRQQAIPSQQILPRAPLQGAATWRI